MSLTIQLGTMNFGGRTPEAEAVKIIGRARELGIEWFDTANAYTGGEAERIVGRALAKDRAAVRIATKVGFGAVAGKPEGLSAAVVRSALDASLQRLGTDYVDVYYLHVPDHRTPLEETLEAMAGVLRSGKARAWAVSNYASWQLLEILQLAPKFELPKPVFSQQIYNLLVRQLDLEYARFAAKYEVATVTYNPLAGGLLAGKRVGGEIPKGSRFDQNPFYQRRYLHAVNQQHVDALVEVARAAGRSLVELAYAWHQHRPVVNAVLVGPGTASHLEEAHAALQQRLSPETLKEIDQLSIEFRGTDTSYAR